MGPLEFIRCHPDPGLRQVTSSEELAPGSSMSRLSRQCHFGLGFILPGSASPLTGSESTVA